MKGNLTVARMKQSLRLNAEEKKALEMLYVEVGATTDNLPRVPAVLKALVDDFNALTDRNDSKEDVLHYMMTRRKKQEWPKLGHGKQLDEVHNAVKLVAEDWPHVDAIYEELQIASDNFACDEQLSKKFAHEFAKRTGKVVPPMNLAASVICRRKSKRLATLKPRPTQEDLGFSDIDEIEAAE
jgi:hypothetical protein